MHSLDMMLLKNRTTSLLEIKDRKRLLDPGLITGKGEP